MYSSSLYKASPIWLQELMVSARAYGRMTMREGTRFRRLLAEAEETQWLAADALLRYQQRHLQRVLTYARVFVPMYREMYRDRPQWPASHSAFDTLRDLPAIDKETIRGAGARARSERSHWPLFESGTSGTSGPPLRLMQDLAAVNRENAFIHRQLQWAGYESGQRRAWIRGDMVVPADQNEPPYWRRSVAENLLVLSSYHLSVFSAQDYLDALARFDPQIIQAYPSSIGFLASYLESRNAEYGGQRLRGVVTSSETLDDDTRRLVARRFGCQLFDWYGQFERVAAIGTCERGTLHIIEDYSHVELRPDDDGLSEIVGTGFNNLVVPLIRYRTGDLVEPAPSSEHCACGRNFRVIRRVLGRSDDPVKLPDGRTIGRLDHIFKGLDGIVDTQIRQDDLQSILILIVPGVGFGSHTVEQIRTNAAERLGSGIRIDVESVPALQRTKAGKFRRVICNV
jgi:phenylacetate-CoA ligase